jgi:hypothetical protein
MINNFFMGPYPQCLFSVFYAAGLKNDLSARFHERMAAGPRAGSGFSYLEGARCCI